MEGDWEKGAANDNYDKSIKSFLSYDDVASALKEHFSATLSHPKDYPPEETMRSVIQRTNSIPTLLLLEQKIREKSVSKLASTFIDNLLRPSTVGTHSEKQYKKVTLDMATDGVLGGTLEMLLRPDMQVADELAQRWHIQERNYLLPERMLEEVRRNRSAIIQRISELEGLFSSIQKDIHSRLKLLREVNN